MLIFLIVIVTTVLPVFNEIYQRINDDELPQEFRHPCMDIRHQSTYRLPWVKASGNRDTLTRMAEHYLLNFNHEHAKHFLVTFRYQMASSSFEIIHLDSSVFNLARVVCNLRNYYQQNCDQTEKLITGLYNRESQIQWSGEAIRLMWELVGEYTPSLGISDVDAKAKRLAADIEDEVVDLIAYTRSGGRVPVNELFKLFQEWNPDRKVTPTAFGISVSAVTGQKSTSSKGVRYYSGFHVPTMAESRM